jgi:hypothetical protein
MSAMPEILTTCGMYTAPWPRRCESITNQQNNMIKRSINRWAVVAAIACSVPLATNAASITYNALGTNPNSGQPVNASATFVTGTNTIGITVNNLLANPNDISQLISDLRFTLSGGLPAAGATLASSSGTQITVNDGGTFVVGPTVSTGWSLTNPAPSTLYLNVLGTTTGPEHLIIGPAGPGNLYSNANGSIAPNPPHNPFLQSGATFNVSLTGVTANTTISSAFFSFGTTPGLLEVPGVPSGSPGVGVPDGGATVMLLGLALFGLGATTRFFKRYLV